MELSVLKQMTVWKWSVFSIVTKGCVVVAGGRSPSLRDACVYVCVFLRAECMM